MVNTELVERVRARWPRKGLPASQEIYEKYNSPLNRVMDYYVRIGDHLKFDDNWLPAIHRYAEPRINGVYFQMGLLSGKQKGVLFCFEHGDALEENEFPYEKLRSVPFFCSVTIAPDDLAAYKAAAESYKRWVPGDPLIGSGGFVYGNWRKEYWMHLPEHYYDELMTKFTAALYGNPFNVCPPITQEFWQHYGHMKLFSKIENDLNPMKRADRNRHFGFTEWARKTNR